MTDITPTAGDTIRPFRSPWNAFPMRALPASTGLSSNVIYLGAIVQLDVNSTTYNHCIVPSSQTSNTVVSTAIAGIAAEASNAPSSTNTQGTMIPCWDVNPHVEFKARTRAGTLASTLVGRVCDILWDSTLKIHLINIGASSLSTAQPRVVVTELLDAIGDSGGFVAFRFFAKDPTVAGSTANVLAFYK